MTVKNKKITALNFWKIEYGVWNID
ncbi:hypothetical protein SCB49_11959 [unidentified eubacterium SCB49]|nr:hypothetical protein SCB49_11959 [unidentified eubacterium SCB49]